MFWLYLINTERLKSWNDPAVKKLVISFISFAGYVGCFGNIILPPKLDEFWKCQRFLFGLDPSVDNFRVKEGQQFFSFGVRIDMDSPEMADLISFLGVTTTLCPKLIQTL